MGESDQLPFNLRSLFTARFTAGQSARFASLLRLLLVLLFGLVSVDRMPGSALRSALAASERDENPSSESVTLATPFSGPVALRSLAVTGGVTATVFSSVKTWGGSSSTAQAKRVALDDSGNLYVAGEFQGTVNFDPAGANPGATVSSSYNTVDAFLVKFNSGQSFQWVRTWGSGRTGDTGGTSRDAANGVAVDSSGDVYVAGLYQGTVDFGSGQVMTSNASIGSNNIFVARFDSSGTTQWVHTWGGTTGGEAYSVAVDSTSCGYVYVQGDWSTSPDTGSVDFNKDDPAHPDLHASHGFYDAFLSRFALDGTFQWAKTWGGHGYDDGTAVAVDNSGNIYVGGMYGSIDINFDPDGGAGGTGHGHGTPTNKYLNVNVFLSKFDSDGVFQWVRTWGGLGTEDAGGAVVADGTGHVYAGGRFQCTNCNFNGDPNGQPVLVSTNGDHDGFVSKYDAAGTFVWARTWGGSHKDAVGNLAVDGANDVYAGGLVSGVTDQNGRYTAADANLTKLTSGGNWQWTKTWGGTGFDIVSGLAVDAAGNASVTGWFQGTVDFDPGDGVSSRTAAGTTDAFMIKFAGLWLPNSGYLPFISTH